MHDIKFRGKDIKTGEWRYGYYVPGIEGNDKHYIVDGLGTALFGSSPYALTVTEVVPETVGQYTGIDDKNSKGMYTGDVVRVLYTDWAGKLDSDPRTLEQYLIDKASVGVVSFEGDRYGIKFSGDDSYNNQIYPGKHGFIEVIGNIHDSP